MEKTVCERGKVPEFENPKQFLLRKMNSKVEVQLKWGQSYEGTLVSVDDYFNILLERATEKVDGETMGDLNAILIRCNNIALIKEVKA